MKCKWFTGVVHTTNHCRTSDGTTIMCNNIISHTSCCLTNWEASIVIVSKSTITITSCIIPWVGGHSEWWPIIWYYITCQSDTTQYGIVKCVSRSTNWCTSWGTDNSNCICLTINTWKVLLNISSFYKQIASHQASNLV